jgi:hypothetical protein
MVGYFVRNGHKVMTAALVVCVSFNLLLGRFFSAVV